MTTSTLAFGKASASRALKLSKQATRAYSSSNGHPSTEQNGAQGRPADPALQRELFMNVLNANATKRDAKQYLARFNSSKDSSPKKEKGAGISGNPADQKRLQQMGVNLGGLYSPSRAIADTPQFIQKNVQQTGGTEERQKIHAALVCLKNPQSLDDATLDGVALTLSQLVKLDMRLLLVLDCGSYSKPGKTGDQTMVLKRVKAVSAEQADRLDLAFAKHSAKGSRFVPDAIEVQQDLQDRQDAQAPRTSVSMPKLLMKPLARSLVPIIPTVAYTPSGQAVEVGASSVMTALTKMLSGLQEVNDRFKAEPAELETSLDRIILLDEAGGIPSKVRGNNAHVFINMEQEFHDITEELEDYKLDSSNGNAEFNSDSYGQHQSNLQTLQQCLAMLPTATSALIITPQEVAGSSRHVDQSGDMRIGIGTRRQKNTLIHNLLTNKPIVSSSLPVARLPCTSSPTNPTKPTIAAPTATLLKRGMPLTIIPATDRTYGWRPPPSGNTTLSLTTDPRIDFPRLLHLIEDSFRRKLDVNHYLTRIESRLAGLIVAGSYEGAALLTWEQPPGTTSPDRLVPYLDKFAVLSSSQGSSGVADIVFQAMVRSCFPHGVCWRSRRDNPVNKWYFERAAGTWQIPDSNWTMFWTGEGVVENEERWEDYVGVCRSVGPSWAGGGKPD